MVAFHKILQKYLKQEIKSIYISLAEKTKFDASTELKTKQTRKPVDLSFVDKRLIKILSAGSRIWPTAALTYSVSRTTRLVDLIHYEILKDEKSTACLSMRVNAFFAFISLNMSEQSEATNLKIDIFDSKLRFAL